MDFSKFDELISKDTLDAIANAEVNMNNYKEVPAGIYAVKIEKMEVGVTGSNSAGGAGRPMLKAQFRIVEGEFKKSCLFLNRVLYGTKNDTNMIASAVGFLKSLDPEADDIFFESYSQFAELVLDLYEDLCEITYKVKYDPKAFNTVSVVLNVDGISDDETPF